MTCSTENTCNALHWPSTGGGGAKTSNIRQWRGKQPVSLPCTLPFCFETTALMWLTVPKANSFKLLGICALHEDWIRDNWGQSSLSGKPVKWFIWQMLSQMDLIGWCLILQKHLPSGHWLPQRRPFYELLAEQTESLWVRVTIAFGIEWWHCFLLIQQSCSTDW